MSRQAPVATRMAVQKSVVAVVFVLSTLAACTRPPAAENASAPAPRLMTPDELGALPSRAPDRRIVYGSEASHYGELRLPAGAGPHPLVILIHGGCFKAEYATAQYFGAMADALKADGIATWNIEYRRLGESGSGWPGTYLDVGHAVDHVRAIAGEYRLDLNRVAVVGHSAGGHLAMWAASRHRLPATSALYVANPLPVRGAMDLAGPVDMTANIAGYEAICDGPVITSMLGGTPAAVPDHYLHASPIKLLPLGVSQVLVAGSYEDNVPIPFLEAYVKAATDAGDKVRLIVIPGAGHFEIASPLAFTWPPIRSAIRLLVEGKSQSEG